MKKIMICLSICSLFACSTSKEIPKEEPTASPVAEQEITSLPEKEKPESELEVDSPLNATNIDDYLFLENTKYYDLRSYDQILVEGGIEGFQIIPFYDVLVWWEKKDNVLFTMSKSSQDASTYLGGVGTFTENYEESIAIIKEIFPMDQKLVFMSTAGVEAAYMINLLKQLGYPAENLYNAGTFTNAIGDIIAYKDYPNHKYYINPISAYSLQVNYQWGELTPITN